MTLEEMAQITLNHWRKNYPKEYRKLDKEWAKRQAEACAKLTRAEMDTQRLINPTATDAELWSEARTLFCLTPPPEPEMPEDPEEDARFEAEMAEARRRKAEADEKDPMSFQNWLKSGAPRPTFEQRMEFEKMFLSYWSSGRLGYN